MFIGDLSITLENLIKLNKGNFTYLDDKNQETKLTEFDISFDSPSNITNISKTTFDLYLFDIKDNYLMQNGESGICKYKKVYDSSKEGKFEYSAIPPYKKVSCSYLVTAWPKVTGDSVFNEQVILGQLFQLFSCFPNIPEKYLHGILKEDENIPLPIVELSQEISMKNRYDFWSLLKIDLHPSFVVTSTISIPIHYYLEKEPPAIKPVEKIDIRTGLEKGQEEDEIIIEGIEK